MAGAFMNRTVRNGMHDAAENDHASLLFKGL